MKYTLTKADTAALDPSYHAEKRYLGWRGADLDRPFSAFYRDAVAPIQPHLLGVIGAPAVPSEYGYEIDDSVGHLEPAGYGHLETGWTRTARGTYHVAVLTDMPGVTAEMWDWWMGWHAIDTARYKLWHPDAHTYTSVGDNRSSDRGLTFRQRWYDNVSYVDEYLGAEMTGLSIRFFDPAKLGFEDRPGTTYICGRVGLSQLPVAAGWLIHQVRPNETGSEMRSRFFLGKPEILALPSSAVGNPRAGRVLTSAPGRAALRPVVGAQAKAGISNVRTATNLLHHCAQEMNHLARLLPDLFEQFRDVP